MNEVAAWLAGEPHSDRPACVSPVLRDYTMRLNDRWPDDERQALKPYAARIVGTAGDGQDDARRALATQAVADLVGPWLTLAGLDAEAASLTGLTGSALRSQLRTIANTAWDKRLASRQLLREKIKAYLKDRPDAVAAAAAAAAAAADDPRGAGYYAAKKVWAEWFATSDDPQAQAIRDLTARQHGAALALLDQMIDPSSVAVSA